MLFKAAGNRSVLFFSRPGEAAFLRGNEQYGLVHIPGKGAVKMGRDSVTPMMIGSVIWPSKTLEGLRRQQRRTSLVTVRDGWPFPLVPAAGIDRDYRGSTTGYADLQTLRNDTSAMADADHARNGAAHERMTRQLFMLLVISVIALIASAAASYAVVLLRG